MMKFQTFLLILMVAIAATACAADSGQETAVVTMPEPATETAPMSEEPAAPAEQEEATEVQTTELSPTPASVPTVAPAMADLPVIGPAPGWDNDVWINTAEPLPLEDLRGKVVLLEFWTFG